MPKVSHPASRDQTRLDAEVSRSSVRSSAAQFPLPLEHQSAMHPTCGRVGDVARVAGAEVGGHCSLCRRRRILALPSLPHFKRSTAIACVRHRHHSWLYVMYSATLGPLTLTSPAS